jgi:hypothetical protein
MRGMKPLPLNVLCFEWHEQLNLHAQWFMRYSVVIIYAGTSAYFKKARALYSNVETGYKDHWHCSQTAAL